MSRTALALVLAVATTLGCVSIRPVAPGTVPELQRGEGLLVVHVRTAIPISMLVLSRATIGSDLAKGEHLYLIAIGAGEYRWTDIVIPAGQGSVPFRMANEEVWKLRVEPGRLSYPGMLVIGGKTHQRGVEISGTILNRSAYALGRLRAEFPGILERYPPVYGGEERDDYLDYFSRSFLTPRTDAAQSGGR